MHQRLFIFLPKIVNMWSMETTNKGKIVGVGKIGTNHSTSIKKCFTYWWSYACFIKATCSTSPTSGIRATFLWLITFDDCFWLSFYCPWWLSLRVMLIVFDDCFWLLFLIKFWLSLMIVFESYVDYWLFFMVVFCYYIFWLFILHMYFCGCTIVSFKAFWYHLILIYSNKR